jgi:F-type H+-transporting ATPase subunit gamma
MALQTKVIKQKIKSVGNIKKITRTMEMVSVSKMKKATASVFSLRPYSKESFELLKHLPHISSSHPFFTTPRNAKKELLVIFASNKGLCGGFNANLYREALRHKKESTSDGTSIEVCSIGKNAEKIAKKLGFFIKASFIHFGDKTVYEDFEALKKVVIDAFDSKEYARISIIHTEFIRSGTYSVATRQVLPLQASSLEELLEIKEEPASQKKESSAEYLIEPAEKEVLDFAIPVLVHTVLFTCFLESLASEHGSRMVAMKSATDNASDMLSSLKISFNKARQDAVTQEIAEIASGALAVSA